MKNIPQPLHATKQKESKQRHVSETRCWKQKGVGIENETNYENKLMWETLQYCWKQTIVRKQNIFGKTKIMLKTKVILKTNNLLKAHHILKTNNMLKTKTFSNIVAGRGLFLPFQGPVPGYQFPLSLCGARVLKMAIFTKG